MATTYADITGRVTKNDKKVGIWSQVWATPLTVDGKVIYDDALGIGPTQPVETDKAGNMPTGANVMQIPSGGTTPTGIYWRVDARPLSKDPMHPVEAFTIGTVQVTGNLTLAQIAAGTVGVIAVTPTLVTDVTAAANSVLALDLPGTYAAVKPIAPTGTNDQAVINTAVTSAVAEGRRTVWLKPGTFAWDADIAPWAVGVELRAVQPGKTTIQLAAGVQFGPAWQGTKTQLGADNEVTTVTAGARSITTAADRSASLTPGDPVMIFSNERFANRAYYNLGEWNEVESVSGTTINLKWPLRFTYTNGSGFGVRIFRLGLVEGAALRGINILSHSAATVRQVGVQMRNCLRPEVTDCRVQGVSYDAGVRFYDSWAPSAERVTAVDVMDLANSDAIAGTSGFTGYGINTVGCLDTRVVDFFALRNRHGFDDSSLSGSAPSLRTKVQRGRGYDCWGGAWSTHGGSDECLFDECVSVNSGGGFVLRGRSPRTRGCTVRGVTNVASNAYTALGRNNQSSIHGVLVGEAMDAGVTTPCPAGTGADLDFDLIDVTGGNPTTSFAVPFVFDQDTPINEMRLRWRQVRGHLSHGMRLWAPTIRKLTILGGRIITDPTNVNTIIDVDPTVTTGSTATGSRAVDGYNQKQVDISGITFDGYSNFTIRWVGNSATTAANLSSDIYIHHNRGLGKNTSNSSAMRFQSGSFSNTPGAIRVEHNQFPEHGVCCSSSTPGTAPATNFARHNAILNSIDGQTTDFVSEGTTNLYHTTARAAAAAPVQTVAGQTGAVTLAKTDVGLGSVDNTADTAKPVSTAQQTALDGKRNVLLPPPRAGYFFPASTIEANTSQFLNGQLRVTPFVIDKAVSLTRIGADVATVGDAGSKFRLGIYADDGTGYPGALVVDAGQIAGDSATVQELVIATTLQPGLYWIGGVTQSVTTTAPTLRGCSRWQPPVNITTASAPAAGTVLQGYRQDSVTAALPATFSTTLVAASGVPRLHLKAS